MLISCLTPALLAMHTTHVADVAVSMWMHYAAIRYGQTPDGEKYWLVKNTWSANWGEQGYIRISRNPSYDCGIATQAIYTDIELAE